MNAIECFGAYRKAGELFDFLVEDMAQLQDKFSLGRLVSQQFASADSICANIEEGYGRISRTEYIPFLDFARGSARETRGRYLRMRHWFDANLVSARVSLLDEIIGILTSTINTLKQNNPSRQNPNSLREDITKYDTKHDRDKAKG